MYTFKFNYTNNLRMFKRCSLYLNCIDGCFCWTTYIHMLTRNSCDENRTRTDYPFDWVFFKWVIKLDLNCFFDKITSYWTKITFYLDFLLLYVRTIFMVLKRTQIVINFYYILFFSPKNCILLERWNLRIIFKLPQFKNNRFRYANSFL